MANMKLVIHWWEDSSGRHTCHKNEKGLSAAESLVGWLERHPDGWYVNVAEGPIDLVGPYPDMYAARRELLKLLDAVVLDSNS